MFDLIGNMLLVWLKWLLEIEGFVCMLVMKLEIINFGGFVKDWFVLEMVLVVERDGLLRFGGTIVEFILGNIGVGLVIVVV